MDYRFFELNEVIDDKIRSNDVDALRGILVGIINRDPTFATKRYDEAIDYIIHVNKIEIYDDRGIIKLAGEYETDSDSWDKEYYRKQLAWLSQNYTEERVKNIKRIGEKVYSKEYTQGKDEAENFHHPVEWKSPTSQKRRSSAGGIVILIAIIIIVTIMCILIQMMGSQKKQDEGAALNQIEEMTVVSEPKQFTSVVVLHQEAVPEQQVETMSSIKEPNPIVMILLKSADG